MSNAPDDPRRTRLLDAALGVFAAYGFRRASMADIAQAAGVSRPALYLHFRSKEDMLRALAERLRDRALEGAKGGWRDGAPFVENLAATLLGKERDIFPLLYGSPHGAEILAADAGLTEVIAADLDRQFRDVLRSRFAAAAEAGAIDLSCVAGDADALAGLVAASLKALLGEARNEAGLVVSVRRLATVIAAAVKAL